MYKEIEIGGKNLCIEIDNWARLSDGNTVVKYGDTTVLVTVSYSREPEEWSNFVPLTVDYRELYAAAGKIPGGFFKREGKPRTKEILISRLMDRSIRPLFPKNFCNQIQVTGLLLSSDQENEPDVLGIIGASLALSTSEIPFNGPIGAVKIGYINGEYVINPTLSQLDKSELNLVIAGTEKGIVMLEGSAKELSEEAIKKAIVIGYNEIKKILDVSNAISREKKKEKITAFKEIPPELIKMVEKRAKEAIKEINYIPSKKERSEASRKLEKKIVEEFSAQYPESEEMIKAILENLAREDMRSRILAGENRVDGRRPDELRPISCAIDVLPRTHGSAIFTRGETQCIAVTTLGTKSDELLIDDIERTATKSFMLHYNFPSFATNEAKPLKPPSRREIGHGALAEKSLEPVMPSEKVFPYTIRVISNILESNGSSSMATVCGTSLSLMAAGVPIKKPVAGAAIGLIKEDNKYVILSDITGLEDHYGDMDFKIAGTREGITGIQLDLKIDGVDAELLYEAMKKAREKRIQILDIMDKTISAPRSSISQYAPKIEVISIPRDKIGEIIGPGGKVIREIINATETTIDINDKTGEVTISASNLEALKTAKKMVFDIIKDVEKGKVYQGTVKKITNLGLFVEIAKGKEGLLHISQLPKIIQIKGLKSSFKVKDKIFVKVINVDDLGRISLEYVENAGRKFTRETKSFRLKDNF